MSLATTTSDSDGVDDHEFDLIVDGFNEPDGQRPVRRRSRWVSEREAIDRGLGFRRHRSRERGE